MVKISVYLNKHVFVMNSNLTANMGLNCSHVTKVCLGCFFWGVFFGVFFFFFFFFFFFHDTAHIRSHVRL